jgi:hypothetical protein
MSSNGKRLCGAESTILIKNQPTHKVDVVMDCSDKKKTRLTVITKEHVSSTTWGKSSKCDLVGSQESTEILTSCSLDENLKRIVVKGVGASNIRHGSQEFTGLLALSSIDENLNRIVAKGVGVPNIRHDIQKWRFDTNNRSWYNSNERKRFF